MENQVQKNIIALGALFVVGYSSNLDVGTNTPIMPVASAGRVGQTIGAQSKPRTNSLLTAPLVKPAPALTILLPDETPIARGHWPNTLGGLAYPPVTEFEKAKGGALVWRLQLTREERAQMRGDTNNWIGIKPATGRVVAMMNP